jgi:hypothetical protein
MHSCILSMRHRHQQLLTTLACDGMDQQEEEEGAGAGHGHFPEHPEGHAPDMDSDRRPWTDLVPRFRYKCQPTTTLKVRSYYEVWVECMKCIASTHTPTPIVDSVLHRLAVYHGV